MTGRFAPTPSGRMHIGNVYAMLGAWLSARKSGDSIRLRIEDIDEPRVVPGAAETMMRDLEWLGLGWDGEPVFQSSRHALYQEALELLSKLSFDEISDIISTGSNDSKPCSTTAGNEAATSEATPLIYPCFCSRADIRAASAPQEGDRFTVYPGTCRRLIASEPQRAKQRLANNDRHSMRIATADTTITFHDEVFGTQQYNLTHDIGDIIVRKRVERNIARWKVDLDIMAAARSNSTTGALSSDTRERLVTVQLGQIRSLTCQVLALKERVDALERKLDESQG